MHLSQIRHGDGVAAVARFDDGAYIVRGTKTVLDLAQAAMVAGRSLQDTVMALGLTEKVDLAALAAEGRLLAPIHHPDPAHLHLTGTGLSHLGRASTRSSMHA